VLTAGALAILLRRRRAAANSELLRGRDPGAALIEAVRGAVLTGRSSARLFGRTSIAEQFGVNVDPREVANLVDAQRAMRVAERHVRAVRQEVAKSTADSAAEKWAEALGRTEWRAKAIAATETASAANAERDEAARIISAETGIVLWKRWNAFADACPICSSVDGETVRVTENFSQGEPGSVHPNCYCWSDIVDESGRMAA
jgi:hypothetical protein